MFPNEKYAKDNRWNPDGVAKTMSSRLLKVAEFSHLGEFYQFDRENKGYGKRSNQTEVTVCVAFDIT